MRRAAALFAPLALLMLTAEAPAPVPLDEELEHVVKAGETLGGIAARAKVPRVLIIEANGLKPPYAVRSGQKLAIPRTRHHTVKDGETGFTIAYAYAVPWSAITVANGIDANAPLKKGQSLLIPTLITQKAPEVPSTAPPAPAATPAATDFAWPLAGQVRRGFTARPASSYHDGIDIRAPEGTAVRAAAAGKVVYADAEPDQFGNLVVIEHPGNWQTAYAFLSKVTVKAGEDVGQGERVGLVGHTGKARGDELHFELRKDNQPVDPVKRLPARK